MHFIVKLNDLLNKITRFALVSFVVTIIVFSLLNIILRWFNTSLMFVDPLVRYLVFACAFLGAVEATERSQNISIDVLKRYFEIKNKTQLLLNIQRVVFILSIIGCAWLAKSGYQFAIIELEYPRELFWGINTGMAASIIPLGFAALSLKSLLRALIYWNEKIEVEIHG